MSLIFKRFHPPLGTGCRACDKQVVGSVTRTRIFSCFGIDSSDTMRTVDELIFTLNKEKD